MNSIKKIAACLPLPLRPTLVTTVVIMIILTGAAIGYSSYVNSSKSVNLLWHNLARQIASDTSTKTLDYLKSAEPFLTFTLNLEKSGQLNVTNPFSVMTYCASAINSIENFILVYYAKPDGSFIGALRSENKILGYLFQKETGAPKGFSTKKRVYEYQNNTWVLKEEGWDNYDSRNRPFWKQGLANPQGSWSTPYIFSSSIFNVPEQIEGITYVKPDYTQDKLQSMWMIDYLANTLSAYLRTLKIGNSGVVLIISDDGTIIANSTGESLVQQGTDVLRKAQTGFNNPVDEIVAKTWKKLQSYPIQSPEFQSAQIEVEDYLSYFQSFPSESHIPWNILTIVPKRDFFGPIIDHLWSETKIAVSLCLVFSFLGAFFFGYISKKLKNVALEMERISAFEMSEKKFSENPSFVKEVNIMHTAIDHMKAGLSSFAKYVPVALVSNLLKQGQSAVLGGKKIEITALFADLANFTQVAEKIAPSELVKMLDQILSLLTHIIQENEGIVDKYFGDAIMALWGALTSQKDHAQMACRTALIMHRKSKPLLEEITKKYGIPIRMRIGINSGDAVVGNIGSSERMDYTAIGDTVNLASRLEELNKYYSTSIFIGENTARKVQTEMLLRKVDYVAVKGKTQVTPVYELIGYRKESSSTLLQAITTYEEGLEHFAKREFMLAKGLFEKANTLFGGEDYPSLLLSNRSDEYQKNPPPPHWKGETIMQLK